MITKDVMLKQLFYHSLSQVKELCHLLGKVIHFNHGSVLKDLFILLVLSVWSEW